MDLQEFVGKFGAQFEETDVSEFKADTKFRDLNEWSSMIALSIIAMVDEEYSVTIKGEDIRTSETIEDLFSKIKSYRP